MYPFQRYPITNIQMQISIKPICDWPKFNQLEMVTTFTYKPSLVRIDARNFELLW